jgi:hypothetical protein
MVMEPQNTQIKVKLHRKDGWEVEITCAESQLKQAIENVLSSLNSSEPMISATETAPPIGSKTCRGLILELWQESWFSSGRPLSQVHDEIARRGYHYDRTAVAHALTDLVKENILTREGVMRNYSYIQKKPPGESSGEKVRIDQVPQFK